MSTIVIEIEGAWHSDGVAPETLHFVPTGLPVALCGTPRGRFQWPDGTTGNCPECSDARSSIEAEMVQEASGFTSPRTWRGVRAARAICGDGAPRGGGGGVEMGKRRPYTTSGVATRSRVQNGSLTTDINIWNGTAFADSDEMARTLTLGAMLEEWPMKDGWERHEAFVHKIADAVLQEWTGE